MPKGALLHGHLDAMVDRAFLLDVSLKQPLMSIRVPAKITASNLSNVLPEFQAFPLSEMSNTTPITSADYEPGTWVNLKAARDTFDPALGGPEGFDKWLIGTMTINPGEAYGTHNSVLKVSSIQPSLLVAN